MDNNGFNKVRNEYFSYREKERRRIIDCIAQKRTPKEGLFLLKSMERNMTPIIQGTFIQEGRAHLNIHPEKD